MLRSLPPTTAITAALSAARLWARENGYNLSLRLVMLLDPEVIPTSAMPRVLNEEDKRRREGDVNRRDAILLVDWEGEEERGGSGGWIKYKGLK